MIYLFSLIDGFGSVIMHFRCKLGMSNKTVRHPLKKTVRYQDKSVRGQIGTSFSFKQT